MTRIPFLVWGGRLTLSRLFGRGVLSLSLLMGVPVAYSAASDVTVPLSISGLRPDRRPVWAPRTQIAEPISPNANKGVEEPLPSSVAQWQKDQGAWYTPFSRSGMTGYYDLRHWHSISEKSF